MAACKYMSKDLKRVLRQECCGNESIQVHKLVVTQILDLSGENNLSRHAYIEGHGCTGYYNTRYDVYKYISSFVCLIYSTHIHVECRINSNNPNSRVCTSAPHLADGNGFRNCDAFGRTITPASKQEAKSHTQVYMVCKYASQGANLRRQINTIYLTPENYARSNIFGQVCITYSFFTI